MNLIAEDDEERGPALSEAGAAPGGALAAKPAASRRVESRRIAHRRDRLLSALNLITAMALLLALPFALQAGSAFFLPLTTGLTLGLMLVPLQMKLERFLPSVVAAVTNLVLCLGVVSAISYIILTPALVWLNDLPSRMYNVRTNLDPLLDLFDSVDQSVDRLSRELGVNTSAGQEPTMVVDAPRSVFEAASTAAPSAIIQTFFALLIMVFFLSSFSRMRGALMRSADTKLGGDTANRLLSDVASDTGRYVGMISIINIILGIVVTGIFWALGVETPWMWGGLAALLNFVPYAGPVVFFFLAILGGMTVATDPLAGMIPALAYLGINLAEAYVLTPLILGRKFLVNPLLIMVALSFWGWVWGTVGALLSVPLLIITKSLIERIGGPNIAGFLLDQTTLIRESPGRQRRNLDREPS
ncbi:AI-2E family transporter [Pacificimonas sp. ICDLI1SI03]